MNWGAFGGALASSALNTYERLGEEELRDMQRKQLKKDIAEKALAGKYPSASDLVYDYSNAKIESMAGYGLPRRVRGGLRMGKGLPRFSYSTYDLSAIVPKGGSGVSGFRVADDRTVTPASAPSAIIQTGSPYQRINSAAMSPFIAASPQLATFKVGGSFMPSGKMGKGFMPSG